MAGARRPCALCGADPEHQHEVHGLEYVGGSQRAVRAKIAKIRIKRTDLVKTTASLEAEQDGLVGALVVSRFRSRNSIARLTRRVRLGTGLAVASDPSRAIYNVLTGPMPLLLRALAHAATNEEGKSRLDAALRRRLHAAIRLNLPELFTAWRRPPRHGRAPQGRRR